MEKRLLAEADILMVAEQINRTIFAFIKVREDDFWIFEEDWSRRGWWSLVRSVATS